MVLQIGPALVELIKPVVHEEAMAAEAVEGNGLTPSHSNWDADPEEEESGKGQEKSQAEKEARKLLKKRAKQLQKQAAAEQQGDRSFQSHGMETI